MSNKTKTTSAQEGAKTALVPKLRFPEFRGTEGWKASAGDVLFDQVNDRNPAPGLPVLAITQEHGAIPRHMIDYHVSVTEKSIESYKVVRVGDFIISLRSFQGGVEYSRYHGICSPAYVILRRRGEGNDEYFRHYLKTDKFIRILTKNLEGLRDGKMVSYAQFSELLLPVPKPSEQQKIADCLSSVDELIAAQSRKLDAIKTHKKGLMQQLFPREGENQPRRRFPDFQNAGKWEKKRIDNRGDVLAGKALAVNAPGPLRPYLRTKNVLDGTIDLSDVLTMPMTDAEFSRFEVLDGDVLLNEGQSSELVGRTSIYRGQFNRRCAMQNQLLRFRAFPSTSPEFAAQAFRQCQQDGTFASVATQTTSVAHLGSSRFRSLELTWPSSLVEQQRIADCLTSLDELIAAQTRKLAAIKAHKRGLMQQLFPSQAEAETQGLVESTLRSVIEDKLPTNRLKNSSDPSNVIEFSRDYSRTVLAAEIIDRIGTHSTFGHVKLQKILFLAEHTEQLDEIESHCVRAAAGPYDREMLNEIDAKLRECEWFSNTTSAKGRRAYHRLARAGEHRESFERLWPEKTAPLRALIDSLKECSTEQCECFATVYGAWNDLLRAGKPVNKEAIFSEIFTRWHPDKTKIPESKWREAHTYLRKNGLVPTGYGKPTRTESDDQPELSI